MRVLVCGARDWENKEFVWQWLDAFHANTPITHIIEGECRGPDAFAREWAKTRGIPFTPYPAQWKKYHRSAGSIRNQQMLDEGKPDLVVGFHNNLPRSIGTKDMLVKASRAFVDNYCVTERERPVRD